MGELLCQSSGILHFFGAGDRVEDLEFFTRGNVITQLARGPS
jgi:hypothetical protein